MTNDECACRQADHENMMSELVAALRGVIAVADRATVEFDRAKAAIAKATGETQ